MTGDFDRELKIKCKLYLLYNPDAPIADGYYASKQVFNDLENVNMLNKNAQNGHPIMHYTCGLPYKEVNNKALNFNTPFIKKNMVSDYFLVRLINDKYSNYKFVAKPFIANEINSIT